MRKNLCLLITMLLGTPLALHSLQTNDTIPDKKIPIVVYSPFKFQDVIMDAFKCEQAQDYYMFKGNKAYIYDNFGGPRYFRGLYQERKLRKVSSLRFSSFKEEFFNHDSCFFFAPTQLSKFNDKYLGIKENGKVYFIDKDGNRYDSLEELLTKIYNAKSLDTFFDIYIKEVKNALYHPGTNNMLYEISSEEQAISILSEHYNFIYWKNKDLNLAIDNFMRYLKSIIDLDEATYSKIRKEIAIYLDTRKEEEYFNGAFEKYLRTINLFYISLLLRDIAPILKNNLSNQNFELFAKRHIIYHNKAMAAYLYLFRKYQDEIIPSQIRGWVLPNDQIIDFISSKLKF